jgi:hypothetical protein
MDFEPVDPRTIDNTGVGHRGRVSYPLLKSFMESDIPMAKVKLDGMQQSLVALRSSLSAYIGSHDLPIKVFQRQGDLYLARLDKEMQEDGTVIDIEDWREAKASKGQGQGAEARALATPINMEEVNSRFDEERAQVTK